MGEEKGRKFKESRKKWKIERKTEKSTHTKESIEKLKIITVKDLRIKKK